MSARKFVHYPSLASAPRLLQGSSSIGWHDDYPLNYLVWNPLDHEPQVLTAVGNVALLASRLGPLADFERGSIQLCKAQHTVAINHPDSGPDAEQWDLAAHCIESLQEKAWSHNIPFQSFRRAESLDHEGQNSDLFPLQLDPCPRIAASGLSDHAQNQILHEYGERRRLVEIPVYDVHKQQVDRWDLRNALHRRRVGVDFRFFHIFRKHASGTFHPHNPFAGSGQQHFHCSVADPTLATWYMAQYLTKSRSIQDFITQCIRVKQYTFPHVRFGVSQTERHKVEISHSPCSSTALLALVPPHPVTPCSGNSLELLTILVATKTLFSARYNENFRADVARQSSCYQHLKTLWSLDILHIPGRHENGGTTCGLLGTPVASMFLFHDGEPMEPILRSLTKAEIENAFPDRHVLRSRDRRTRSSLLSAISQCSPEVQNSIRDCARRKAENICNRAAAGLATLEDLAAPRVDYVYMDPPTPDTVKACERQFIARTGNDCVKTDVCCSCARRTSNTDLSHYRLANIPNRHLLRPQTPHHAHALYDGALLHRAAVKPDDTGLICTGCLRYLKRNKIPPLSLANGIFLGDVPFELRLLSLAEKILIAIYYPAAYIIKLYPKDPRARAWDHRLFTNGLKGNVASYPLNPTDVASYIAPSVLPPHSRILSSTICVTFVGPNSRPERFFPDTVYVRRSRICDALVWLKANNPLYRNIVISEDNLSMLPEDRVPDDICYGAHLSTDETLLGQEQDNYVPEEPNPESFALPGVEDLSDDDEDVTGVTEPLVVPLQPSSVIDATGSHLTERDVSSNALTNTASTSKHLNENEPAVLPKTPTTSLGLSPGCPHTASWALMYEDGRFCKDYYFSPMVFGVIRKRQVAHATSIEMSRTDYSRNLNIIVQLTPEDFTIASNEEAQSEAFSNPAMRALRQSMTTAARKVVYTDASIKHVRSIVWGTVTECGPPMIWFTLNPSDLHNPVAQVFVGQDIDLDEFEATFGPSSTEPAINVAQDPAGAALFCHHLFKAVLECLFGIVGAKGSAPPSRRPGVLGTVDAYVGTIEAQGCGTLHMHCLLWLSNTQVSSSFDMLLSEELFRERVVRYIGSVMRADIDGLDTNGILAIPTLPDVSFSRPIHPDDENYETLRKDREKNLARSLQLHTCSTHACLQRKNGRLACKRGVPFDCADQDWVASNGRLGPKRHCPQMNNWNLPVLVMAGCNNDLKVITHRLETKDATFYMSNYQLKGSQTASHNISALLVCYHIRKEQECTDIGASAKRLLTKCLNSLNHLQEFGGPQITVSGQSRNKVVFIDQDVELRDQLHDYQYRGDALEEYNLYQFLIHTYEGDPIPNEFQPSARGRSLHGRIPYRSGVHARKCRLVRKPGHETHPNFIGKWFPRNDRAEEAEEHAAMMLMLFRPWRLLADLKPPFGTFCDQYHTFMESAPDSVSRYINNIQYYHQGMDRRSVRRANTVVTLSEDQQSRQAREDATERNQLQPWVVTEATLELARRERRNAKLILWGEKAIRIARQQGTFGAVSSPDIASMLTHGTMTQDLQARLRTWTARLQAITFDTSSDMDDQSYTLQSTLLPVAPTSSAPPSVFNPHLQIVQVPRHLPSSRPGLDALHKDQRLVHDIVEKQLLKHLNNKPTEQLLMLCLGEGGTGKTKIIKEVTETYREHGYGNLLSRTATSGVAATLIEGKTLHSWLGLGAVLLTGNQWMNKLSANMDNKRKRKMLGRPQLTDYVRRRNRVEQDVSSQPFGGLDVILFGDFHQFPPVARSGKALYEPSKKEQDTLGHQLYQQFTTVVILQEQMRVQDQRWLSFLKRLRVGGCHADDLHFLRRLSLTNPECVRPDYTRGPWLNPVLVTSRRAVKDSWNKEALIKHCLDTKQVRYICPALDTVKNHTPTLEEKEIIIKGLSDDFALEEEVEIAVGAHVMIEMNIATEAGLANGTRGKIVDIILDEQEGPLAIGNDGSCRLLYPPALVWFLPDNPCQHVFDPSRPGLIPLTPSSQRFSISVNGKDNLTGKRVQLPLALAYAFTDYKSQGQTLDAVLVDLDKPPDRGNPLTSISAYVALSRALFTTPPPTALLEEDHRLARGNPRPYDSKLVKYNARTGFLGRYLGDTHPFNWKVDYPMDFVVDPSTVDVPATLTVVGHLRSDLSQLGPLGDFEDECQVLSKSQYTVVVQTPGIHPLSQAWNMSMDVLYNLHDRMKTGNSGWTLNIPGGNGIPGSIPFCLHAPLGPFTAAHMTFTRPVFTMPNRLAAQFGSRTKEKILELEAAGMTWTDVEVKNTDGTSILSWDYPKILDRSLVAVDFQLGHSSIFGRDDYVALLKSVTVEVPGPGTRVVTSPVSDDIMPDLETDSEMDA
ncbi:hypothetical protein NP233_g3490 [Leucocoprinus birnbaumii]|uniref:ATP-dependent DNA helicase n=1 Tax=Leucocoprinus birnbaumii TaxID=56174 RepID=A0AAD5W2Y9_9AGAR|nr:hypothetical protein NP233_g3490 [Leucocoprinus birnbaumii]